MEIMVVEEGGYISNEEANKNWGKWAKMGRQKMSIIQELDEWLKKSKSGSHKTISIERYVIKFYSHDNFLRWIKVSVFKDKKQILNKDFRLKEDEGNAKDILEFVLLALYDISQDLENLGDAIQYNLGWDIEK